MFSVASISSRLQRTMNHLTLAMPCFQGATFQTLSLTVHILEALPGWHYLEQIGSWQLLLALVLSW